MKEFFKKFDLPPIWTALAILAIFLINRFLPNPSISAWVKPWLGYILIIYGAYLIIWSIRTFRRSPTSIHPKAKPKELLISGPYSISRNPIYTGMVLIAFGFAIVAGSIYGFLAVIGLFVVLKNRFVMPEEMKLLETFGHEAEDYVAKTRRW